MTSARIMIVEDENVVALDIQSRVESLGYSVVAMARSGEKAIEKVSNRKIPPEWPPQMGVPGVERSGLGGGQSQEC